MSQSPQLVRQLGFLDAVSIVVGVVIGAGIFLVPGLVARTIPATGSILAVWVAGGVVSFIGALAVAELGAMMPDTGGQYVFLREAYGPMVGFLYGWSSFLVSHSAAIAWLGVSFALYLSYFVPLSPLLQKAVGLAAILVLAIVNYRGVMFGATVQKLFAAAKVTGIVILVAAGLSHSGPAPAAAPVYHFRWSDFGVALIACFMTYDGWVCVSSVAGEVRNPRKTILRALAVGVGLCMAIYILANVAYLHVLGVSGLAASERPGAVLADRTLGPAGATIVSALILISIAGGLNGWLLTQPRVYFAQARDGLFFRRFGEVHPRFRTPGFAVLMQLGWSAVLLLTGSFELLISYAMFSIWTFYALTAAAVIVLRRKQPDRARPYRMFGYPFTPALFVAAAVWFLVNMLIEQTRPSLIAAAIIAAGIPVYSERGTGGGWSLVEGYRSNLTGLTEAEVQALFLTRPAGLLADLGLDKASTAGLIKLQASLPLPHQRDATFAQERIYVDLTGWNNAKEAVPVLPTLLQAVWNERKVQISYQRGECDAVERILDPLGLVLKAGTWYLVLSGCGSGAATIHFQHLPVGSGTLTQGTTLSGTVTLRGTTTGTGLVAPSCVTTPTGPEDTYWTVTCPEFTATPFTASTCGAATWDTVLDQRSATRSPVSVCNDDSCGFQSLITGTLPAGAGLHTMYIDGYNATSLGAYTATIRFGACPTGQTACGATCVNLQTDNTNCGSCGNACPTGQTCATGRCACATGTSLCSGACVNLLTSNTNCGACGNACPTGQTCTVGRCACPTGQTACGTTCVNLLTDSANCGRCGGACATGQTCTTGRCVCPTGTTLCGGACVNTQTDATNCGACGTRCATGQTCTTGRCTCPTGQTACGATCTTLTADRANCGACGNACAANANCSTSRCSVINDARTSPIVVPLLATETTVTGTTASATFDGPTTCGGTTGPNVWYRITLAAREILYVDTAGSAYDTRLSLLDSTGAMVAGSCNDDAGCNTGGFTNGFQSRFAVVVPAGTYDIAVGGFDARSSGAFTLHVQHLPTNQGSNFLATAITGTATTMSRTLGAGGLFTPSCAAGPSGEDVRWFVTCGGTTQSVFSNCPADGATWTRRAGSVNYDPVMVVWSGNTNAQVTCNDDGPGTVNCRGTGGDTMNYGARIQAAVPRGVATVIVDDVATSSGLTYTLRHQIAP